MTAKPIARAVDPLQDEYPEPPPREDMQNTNFLNYPAWLPALFSHYGFSATMIITSETPMGERGDTHVPDLLIAFDIDRNVVIRDKIYTISGQGKPPDFVLEIASKTTADNDEDAKRADYARYGVPEYWRFDDTGGDFYRAPLASDQLADGKYLPIPVEEASWARIRGFSAALNLYVCWEYGHLRFYDPARQRYLPSYYEEAARADAAEARNRELEAEIRRLRGQS